MPGYKSKKEPFFLRCLFSLYKESNNGRLFDFIAYVQTQIAQRFHRFIVGFGHNGVVSAQSAGAVGVSIAACSGWNPLRRAIRSFAFVPFWTGA